MSDQDAFLAQFLPKASGAPAAKGPAKKAPKAAGRPAGRASASKIPSTAEDCKIGGWYKVAGTIMREGEAMDSNKAGYLDAGVEVEILERGSGETGRRVRVRAGKQEGWISVVSSAGVSLLKPVEASVSATILQELTGGRGASSSKAKPGDSIASLLGSWAGGEDAQAEEALGPSIADLLSGSLSGNFEDLAADEAAKLPEEEKVVNREEIKEAREEPPVAEPPAEEAARQPAREQDAGLRPSRASSRFAAFSQRAAQQTPAQPQPQASADSTREEEKGKAEVDEAPQEAPAEQKEVKPSKALSRFDRWSQGAGAAAPKPAAAPVQEKPAPDEAPREPQEQPAAPPASSPPEEQKAAMPTRARTGRSRFDSWQQAKSSGSGA